MSNVLSFRKVITRKYLLVKFRNKAGKKFGHTAMEALIQFTYQQQPSSGQKAPGGAALAGELLDSLT